MKHIILSYITFKNSGMFILHAHLTCLSDMPILGILFHYALEFKNAGHLENVATTFLAYNTSYSQFR